MRLICTFKCILGIIIYLVAFPVHAKEMLKGPVTAHVLKVIDGDTLDVQAQIWLGQHIQMRVRLLGVDTPELRGKCIVEKQLAQKAKTFLIDRISDQALLLKNIHYGKYAGRVLADIELMNGDDLAEVLIQKGLGRAYLGGRRKS